MKVVTKVKTREHRLNGEINSPSVRVVQTEGLDGVISLSEAINFAQENEADVILINENVQPPIVVVKEYSKYKFEQKKKEKENKAKTKTLEMKELRFGPHTSEHDFDFKSRHALEFLKAGHKVKAVVKFAGREIQHKHLGEAQLNTLAERLSEVGSVSENLKLEGKKMFIVLSPK